jgi:hypothetical protein
VLPGAAAVAVATAPARAEVEAPASAAEAPAVEAGAADDADAARSEAPLAGEDPALDALSATADPELEPFEDEIGLAALAPETDEVELAERRRVPRGSYAGRRVVALGDEAARVLIGRDLSPGGMRIDPNPRLQVGQRLRVALHVSQGEAPVVVEAEVDRDDGALGLVLRFRGVPDPVVRYLTKMVDSLPVLEASSSSAERVVISEILDAEPG